MLFDIDETMVDSTWADGYGRWNALVAVSGNPLNDARRARRLIRDELFARSRQDEEPVVSVTLVRITEHGTAIYAEKTDTPT